ATLGSGRLLLGRPYTIACTSRNLFKKMASHSQSALFARQLPPQLDLRAAALLLAGMVLKEACGVPEHSEKFLVGAILLVAHSLFMSAVQPRCAASHARPRRAPAGASAPPPRRPGHNARRQRIVGAYAPGRPERGVTCDVDLQAEPLAASSLSHAEAPISSKSSEADKVADTQSRNRTSAKPACTKSVYNRCRGLRGECLRLYVEVLESGAAVDLGFFKAVAGSLDEAALRESAVDLLRAMREKRLVPDLDMQMQLTSPFKGRLLPDDLMEVFWDLWKQGCGLCARARQSLMVAHERKAPERTLELYEDMKWLGIKLDRLSCNAVLCALAQGGRADEALELFEQMTNDDKTSRIGLTPNAKSYGAVIRACTAGGKDQMAVALFDYMVANGTMPNRFAYHDAILSCMRLKQIERALNLYANMKRDRVPPCDHTLRLLIRTCSFCGLHDEAASISEDFRWAKSAEGRAESEATTDFRESSADGESE
ncbi:unnamed protein product, partial [Prorocentrum cordatum]